MDSKVSALLIIDMQNDFISGSLAVNQSTEIIDKINELRDSNRFNHVIYTVDAHPDDHISFAKNHPGKSPFTTIDLPNGTQQELWPAHCVKGTEGSEFHQLLKVNLEKDIIIEKGKLKEVDSYSGFGKEPEKTSLEAQLKELKVNEVYVVGLAFDFCVGSTAIDSYKCGFDTYIIKDATRSVSQPTEEEMNQRLSNIQIIDSSSLVKSN